MNILVWTAHFLPHVGGVENFSARLWPLIAAKAHCVHLFTCNTERVDPEEIYNGVHVHRLRCAPLLSGRFPIPLGPSYTSILSDIDFHVAVTNTRFFPTSLLGALEAKKRRRPYLHIEYGSGSYVVPNPIVNTVVKLWDLSLGRYILRNAAAVAAVSTSAAEYCSRLGASGVHIVPNAIDTSRFDGADPIVRRELGLAPDVCVILFAGRLIREKGIELFIRLARDLSCFKTFFVVAGDGPCEPIVRRAASASKNLAYLGKVNMAQMPQIFASADIVCHPSWYLEGLPTVLLEGGAAGCALVAARTTGVDDIIPSSDYGLVVKPQDYESLKGAVGSLILDVEKRKRLGQAIRQRVREEFDIQTVASRIESLLNAIVTNSQASTELAAICKPNRACGK